MRAVIKLFIYTLVGSLLMLAAAIATAVLLAGDQHISFVFSDLAQRDGRLAAERRSQNWIFLFFAAAFLIKMPAFPFHGWMPDGYLNMPLPVLAVFSGVLSKVAAYGFLKICLPLFPDASAHFQTLMLLLALALDPLRLGDGVHDDQRAPGARLLVDRPARASSCSGSSRCGPRAPRARCCRRSTTGSSSCPAFFVVALLAARAGSEDLRDMGGGAFRAPVLAALFLIVALATLAMPGSSNFAGEFLILLGVFKAKTAIAIIAFTGVAMASVYMLRLFIRAMHNRVGPSDATRRRSPRATGWSSCRWSSRSSPSRSTRSSRWTAPSATSCRSPAPGRSPSSPSRRRRHDPRRAPGPAHRLGGALAAHRAARRRDDRAAGRPAARPASLREVAVPLLTIGAFGAALGLGVWQWDDRHRGHRRRAARRRPHAGGDAGSSASPAIGDGAAVLARAGAARGGARRVLRAAAHRRRGHGWCSPAPRTW